MLNYSKRNSLQKSSRRLKPKRCVWSRMLGSTSSIRICRCGIPSTTPWLKTISRSSSQVRRVPLWSSSSESTISRPRLFSSNQIYTNRSVRSLALSKNSKLKKAEISRLLSKWKSFSVRFQRWAPRETCFFVIFVRFQPKRNKIPQPYQQQFMVTQRTKPSSVPSVPKIKIKLVDSTCK